MVKNREAENRQKKEKFIFICFPSKLKEYVQAEQAFEDSFEADSYFQNVQCSCPLGFFPLSHYFLVSLKSPRTALSVPFHREQVGVSGSSEYVKAARKEHPTSYPMSHKLLGKA